MLDGENNDLSNKENIDSEKVKNNENSEPIEKMESIENLVIDETKKDDNINETEDLSDKISEESSDESENSEKLDKKNMRRAKYKTEISVVDSDKKRKNKLLIVFLCVIILLIMLIGSFLCYTKMYTKVFNNVYLFGENMSGKSEEEVISYVTSLSESINNLYKNDNTGIDIYQDTESIYKVLPSDFDFKIDIAKTSQNIMNYGRGNGIFSNSANIIKAIFNKVSIEPVFSYNNGKIEEIVKNIELTIKNRFVDDKYSLDEKNSKLVITKGTTGNTINCENEKEKLIALLEKRAENSNMSNSLKLDIITKKPTMLDVEIVYNEVKREPKDAYIDESKTPIELVNEKVGYDFDVKHLKEELEKKENQEEGKTIEYALTVIEPKVKLSDITYTLYRDKIAGYTTYFTPGVYARSTNLKIALSYLNDKVIMPGETFSYNAAVGDVNASKGYQAAAVFKGGTTVNEIGGGICQTTSTLYNVALMANMQIVERYQHGLPVGYVKPSLDATVYSPALDFKFKNTRKYPVKIVTSFTYDGSLNISFYGTKEETEYDIELASKYLRTINFSTKYIYDDSLPEGQQVVVSAGVNGYQSESYITKKLNGKVVSSKLLSRDTYNAQQRIVKIGTKK